MDHSGRDDKIVSQLTTHHTGIELFFGFDDPKACPTALYQPEGIFARRDRWLLALWLARCHQGRAEAKDSRYNLFVVTAWLKYFKTVQRML